VLTDVGVERVLVVGRFEVVEDPRNVPGDTHSPQLAPVTACALPHRNEELAGRVDVETASGAVKDVEGVRAEIIGEQLIKAELMRVCNAGQPR
jgi:hypothetical protein